MSEQSVTRPRLARLVGIVLLALLLPHSAQAQPAWPDKPLTIVIPTGPGSSVDRLSHIMQPHLSRRAGVPVVLRNVPGGGFINGALHLLGQPPDGHSLLIMATPDWLQALRNGGLRVDEFAYLGFLNIDPAVLAVSPTSPIKTLQDLIRTLKADPNRLTFGATPGHSSQLALLELAARLGLRPPRWIAYDSGGKLVADFLGGHFDILGYSVDGAKAYYPDRFRVLAVFADVRMPHMPGVPTVNEALRNMGLKNVIVPSISTGRFIATSARIRQTYPDRLRTLETLLRGLAEDQEFKDAAERVGFRITWVDSERTRAEMALLDRLLLKFTRQIQQQR
ncbi:MAG: tripartite tricarboxylate transporter substrate binding protein [Armatimonadota bacterium]|nr:tripartite tricarboxylate transporter substrate binding protein [Armatimonadota bacterium]MDR7459964.1 tripartite tricarboxylate transporter substrate binding protein [Armatimonadota bacterium]MDR7479590.1 tripartite tricarboxylate transporter substrate binding protein [Armatimonadota bacterium]MDR7490563.1 tripartite tricarboxylate transporter substrate binding protein [Armatimonadota bacterium]MDR7526547.1 tripartite tricarboxylate transporter substrate binding protein [Armatimonadota bact